MIYGDYHTHTPYSHGNGTIADNVDAAINRGLRDVAITDHDFSHICFGLKKGDLNRQRKEIDALKIPEGMRVLLGVEMNICSTSGDMNISDEDMQNMDIMIAGYHHIVKVSFRDFFRMTLPNLMHKVFKTKASKRTIRYNTMAVINTLKKYPIDILTHMGYGAPVDVRAVADVCVETNTYVELNGKRINFSPDDIEYMIDIGVMFVVNSDAHSADRVGECDRGLTFAMLHRIPDDRIVNINGLLPLKKG